MNSFPIMRLFILFVFCLIIAVSAEYHNEHHNQHLNEKYHETNNNHNRLHKVFRNNEGHHQHLKEKSHDRNKQYSVHHHDSHFVHHSYRTNDKNQHCSWVCTDVPANNSSSELGLQVSYNSSSSIFALESRSSNLALVIDYSSNIILLINGQSETTIILDIQSQQIIRLPLSSQTLWTSSKGNLEEYIQKVSVKVLLNVGQQYGEKSQLSNLPEALGKEIEENFKSLGIPLPPKEIWQLLTAFSTNLKTVLSVIYRGSGSFSIHNNFQWFLKLNVYISSLLKLSGIDLSKINLDPASLFQGTSGIETAVKLFSELGKNADLSKLAENLLSTREKSLQFLSDVSSGSHNGLDGLITILANIIKTLGGQGSIGEVISSILKYNGTALDEPTYAQVINQALEICKAQNNSPLFAGVIKFLHALVNNNLFLSTVNIGDIVKIFFSPNPIDRIRTVIKVLSTFAPQKGIPQFLGFIKELFNSTDNAGLISRIIPGFNISQFNGLQNLLHGTNLTQLLSRGGNISSVLSQIPVFGPISSQISSVIQQGGENLEKYLDPSHLQSIFQNGLGNMTSGNILNPTQGGLGGIASGIQHGVGQILNSTQGGGFFSGIQNGIGNLFGFGTRQSTQTSTVSPDTSPGVSEDSNCTGTEDSKVTELPQSNETIPNIILNGTGSSNGTENIPIGGNINPLGLRGFLAGGWAGGLSLRDKNKVEHHSPNQEARNHKQRAEDKHHQ